MIRASFDDSSIKTVDFFAALSNGNRFFVPTDWGVQNALKGVLRDTIDAFESLDGVWALHDISEDYGQRRRIYTARTNPLFQIMSEIFELGALGELPDLQNRISQMDYYFARFQDDNGRTVVGVKKGTAAKATLGAQNKLIRLVDNTLRLIEDRVLRLDRVFDVVITVDYIFILEPRPMEQVAKLVEMVAASAAAKVQYIHDSITFLDLSRVKDKIAQHPKLARIAHSVAANPNLAQIQRAVIEELARVQGVRFKEINGRLRCNVTDESKLLEILDARRYHLDLTATGAIPYRASARQAVTA